ncbi:MAG: hypothetical protein ABI293_02820 [Rhodanobacter sp.]
MANLQDRVIVEHDALVPYSIDMDAVDAAEILDKPAAAIFSREPRMMRRHVWVIEYDVVVIGTTDRHGARARALP